MDEDVIRQAEKEYLDFLYQNYKKGIFSEHTKNKLIENGYIHGDIQITSADKITKKKGQSNHLSEYRKYAEKYKDRTIFKKDWCPDDVLNHTQEFYDWINSMTYSFFPAKINYEKFELYKAQAYKWLLENVNPDNSDDEYMRNELIFQEFRRCDVNTMYFAEKYGRYSDGDLQGGESKFICKEHNAVVFYLLDCGYSIIIDKPRQGFFTTQLGLFALKKIIINSNYRINYISDTVTKAEKIFASKIKFPFSCLPKWLKPNVLSERGLRFWTGYKPEKGNIEPPNSWIYVLAATPTAINSESPQLCLIDEAADIDCLTEMLLEARPTMFVDKHRDGNLQMVRQIVAWSTGVYGNKGKGAFKNEWYSNLKLWEEKNFSNGFIPVFFSWHTRCSEEVYLREKANYYGGKAADTKNSSFEMRKQIFGMHFPSSYKDSFVTTSNMLVSQELIDEGKMRILNSSHKIRPKMGYFEPVLDITKPEGEGSDTPYRVIDARFVEVSEEYPEQASVMMLTPPNREWRWRYYLGVDAIAVETGNSNMAGVIWDEELKTPVCIMDFKKRYDNRYTFLQCMLMALYYDTHTEYNKMGVPELIEANAGGNYINYREFKDLYKNLVWNGQLPPELHGGCRIGVDNRGAGRGSRSLYIINQLRECITLYNKNFMFVDIFRQLDTFVEHQKNKVETWGSVDKRLYKDDILFALAFAYICRKAYNHKIPQHVGFDAVKEKRVRYERVLDLNTGKRIFKPILS